MSCCGRGGSWFGTCGRDGNSNLEHTWSAGIWACKPRDQSKTVIGYHLSGMEFFNSTSGTNSKSVITAAKTVTFAPDNVSTPTLATPAIITPANTSVSASIKTSMRPDSTSTPCDSSKVNPAAIAVVAVQIIPFFVF